MQTNYITERVNLNPNMAKSESYKQKKKNLNLLLYTLTKANSNILITGSSGSGKTYLMKDFLALLSEMPQVIFSFKPNDDYLKLKGDIIELPKFMPDVFNDKEAFIESFNVAYPIDMQGIMASALPSLLRDMLNKSKNWNELINNILSEINQEKDNIRRSNLIYIGNQLKSLYYESNTTFNLTFKGRAIFDFSRLNESAKSFYAEYILRSIWNYKQFNKGFMIIALDEVHRLLRAGEKTIYNELLREGRSAGLVLMSATQNYADIPTEVKNQFDTQFTFKTTSNKDLTEISAINPAIAQAITSLPLHSFVDLRFDVIQNYLPIWTMREKRMHEDLEITEPSYKAVEIKAEIQETKNELEEPVKENLNKPEDEFTDMVEKSLPDYAYNIAKKISSNTKEDIDKLRLKVNKSLKELYNKGVIDRINLETGKNDIVLYYHKGSNISELHEYMKNKAVETLKALGVNIIKTDISGQEGADIECEYFNVEIETGLKHNTKDVFDRIKNSDKPAKIIVPNKMVKDEYKNNIPKIEVLTLRELQEMKDTEEYK
uniref:FtzK domain-containing protein n=2 Tax=Picrophilus oshimae TaxID=46632 RepID=G5CCL2_9ARCH|nr:FtzK domain-containing protein [Picrophilus oshimae]